MLTDIKRKKIVTELGHKFHMQHDEATGLQIVEIQLGRE